MKARGLPSPDVADALARTFAVPTVIPMRDELGRAERERCRLARLNAQDPMAVTVGTAEHDPYAQLAYLERVVGQPAIRASSVHLPQL